MDFLRGLGKTNQAYEKVKDPHDETGGEPGSLQLTTPPKAYTHRSGLSRNPGSSDELLLYDTKTPQPIECLAESLETFPMEIRESIDERGATEKIMDLEEENKELRMQNLELKANLETTSQQLDLTLQSWTQAEDELGKLLTFIQTGFGRRQYHADSEGDDEDGQEVVRGCSEKDNEKG